MLNDVTPSRRSGAEIDLLALAVALWGSRFLILGVTLACVLGASVYLYMALPYYQVTSVLQPPVMKALDELNGTKLFTLTPQEALNRVGTAVSSWENRFAFALANKERLSIFSDSDGSFEQAFERFSAEAFKVSQPDPKKDTSLSPFIGLTFTYPETVDGASYTNDFIQFAMARERQRLEDDFNAVVANRLAVLERQVSSYRASYTTEKESRIAALLENDSLRVAKLKDELAALRQMLLTRRNNRIAALDENIAIAKALNIHKPTHPTSLGDAERVAQGSIIRTEVNTHSTPLYFMGTEALEAERNTLSRRRSDDFTEPRIAEIQKELRLLQSNREVEVLSSRKNDDLFLKRLARSREEQARLQALSVDFSNLQLATVDRLASQPLTPVGPRKLLVLAIAGVLGGMLGVMLALVRVFLRQTPQAKVLTSFEVKPELVELPRAVAG